MRVATDAMPTKFAHARTAMPLGVAFDYKTEASNMDPGRIGAAYSDALVWLDPADGV